MKLATELVARTSSNVKSKKPSKGKEIDNTVLGCTPVTNICNKIMAGFNSDPCSEYLKSDDHMYYVFSRTSITNQPKMQQPSLEDIIRGSGINLSRRQRYTMSLNLVSSFIQLRKTPWITSSWQKSSIVFPEQKGYPDTSDLHEPFLTHRLRASPAFDEDSDLSTQDFSSLAVTLLELCFGEVIENHPKRPKLPPGVENDSIKAAFDAHAASFWLDEVTDDVGPDYRNAIAWCLSKHKTLCGPDWRQEMFQQVIRPLYEITKPWASHSL